MLSNLGLQIKFGSEHTGRGFSGHTSGEDAEGKNLGGGNIRSHDLDNQIRRAEKAVEYLERKGAKKIQSTSGLTTTNNDTARKTGKNWLG